MSLSGTLLLLSQSARIRPGHRRRDSKRWYDTTCCPNHERTFASLPGLFLPVQAKTAFSFIYSIIRTDWHLEDERQIKITQKTNSPGMTRYILKSAPGCRRSSTLLAQARMEAGRVQITSDFEESLRITKTDTSAFGGAVSPGDKISLILDMTHSCLIQFPRH